MKIKFLIAAEEHLEYIYNSIETKSVLAATNLFNDILDEIEILKDFPKIVPIEPALRDELKEFRSLVIRHNYKVIYYFEESTIYIAAIWDCRQNPKSNKKKIR